MSPPVESPSGAAVGVSVALYPDTDLVTDVFSIFRFGKRKKNINKRVFSWFFSPVFLSVLSAVHELSGHDLELNLTKFKKDTSRQLYRKKTSKKEVLTAVDRKLDLGLKVARQDFIISALHHWKFFNKYYSLNKKQPIFSKKCCWSTLDSPTSPEERLQ